MQMSAAPTPPSTSSDDKVTLTSSPAPVCPSPSTGACSPSGVTRTNTPSVKHPPEAKKLTKKERKHLKAESRFAVVKMYKYNSTPPRQGRVVSYDEVREGSVYMDTEAGVYRTPLKGKYKFECSAERGISAVDDGYLCGGDGRRKKLGYCESFGIWDRLVWDCPEGLSVWVEVETWDRYSSLSVVFAGRLTG